MDQRQKIRRTLAFGLIIVAVCGLVLHARDLHVPAVTWRIDFTPVLAEVDAMGSLWLADAAGNLHRYRLNDQSIASFQPDRPGRITSIDCSQTLRTLCFYQESQQYILLNRFLTESPWYALPAEQGPFTSVCLTSDNHIWAFSQRDFSIHKIRLQNPEIIFSVSLVPFFEDSRVDIQSMKEYKNRLYIAYDDMHIAVFDRLGKKIEDIELQHNGWLGFSNDDLCVQDGDNLVFKNLRTGVIHSVEAPVKNNGKFLRPYKDSLIQISDALVNIYKK